MPADEQPNRYWAPTSLQMHQQMRAFNFIHVICTIKPIVKSKHTRPLCLCRQVKVCCLFFSSACSPKCVVHFNRMYVVSVCTVEALVTWYMPRVNGFGCFRRVFHRICQTMWANTAHFVFVFLVAQRKYSAKCRFSIWHAQFSARNIVAWIRRALPTMRTSWKSTIENEIASTCSFIDFYTDLWIEKATMLSQE